MMYDTNGNLIYSEADGLFRVYNSENRLWKIHNGTNDSAPLLQEITWDLVDDRILMKTTYYGNSSWKEKVIYVTPEMVRVKNESGTFDFLYIYHEGQLIAQKNPDGSVLYYHPDHLGSTTLVTNQNGQVVENTSYEPYGLALSGGDVSRFDYEAKEYDPLTTELDFHFRKYSPSEQFYRQPDDRIQNAYDPQQLNRYSFERNNPYRYIDFSGHTFQGGALGATQLFTGLSVAVGGAALILSGGTLAVGLGLLAFFTGSFISISAIPKVVGGFANNAEEDRKLHGGLESTETPFGLADETYQALTGKQDLNRQSKINTGSTLGIESSVGYLNKQPFKTLTVNLAIYGVEYAINYYALNSPGVNYFSTSSSVSYPSGGGSSQGLATICRGGVCFKASTKFADKFKEAVEENRGKDKPPAGNKWEGKKSGNS